MKQVCTPENPVSVHFVPLPRSLLRGSQCPRASLLSGMTHPTMTHHHRHHLLYHTHSERDDVKAAHCTRYEKSIYHGKPRNH